MIGQTLWQVIRRTGGGTYGAWEVGQDLSVITADGETTTNPDASQIGIAGRPCQPTESSPGTATAVPVSRET